MSEEDLMTALGGQHMSYEEAKEYAIEHGIANVRHGGYDSDELFEEDLKNVYGGSGRSR